MLIKILGKRVRELAVWLYQVTREWVVDDIPELIDNEEFDKARAAIERQREAWGNDVELSRCEVLIYRITTLKNY